MHKIDAHPGVLSQADNVAEGEIFGNVIVHQVEIIALRSPFSLQLLRHIANDLILLSMYSHNTAMFGHFSEDGPQMTVGDTDGMKGGKDLETGDPFLNRLADLTDL